MLTNAIQEPLQSPQGAPLSDLKALVLNADYQPLTTFPLSLWDWEKSVEAVLSGRVIQIATYDQVVRSPSLVMEVPSVVVTRQYVPMNRPAALTRLSLHLRDGFRCGYCMETFRTEDLTFDHIVPRCQGGTSLFTNLVSACVSCNVRKGGRTPEQARMPLRLKAWHPTRAQLNEIGKMHRPTTKFHETWVDYVYWMAELEA